MDRVKNFFKERGLGFYLAIVAMIIAIITIFLYKAIGITVFSPTLNQQTILFLILGSVVIAISLVMSLISNKNINMFTRLVRYIAYLMYLYAFIMFIYSQINFIANVFVAIDGNSFSGTFILTLIFYILACVLTVVSSGLNSYTPWNKKKLAKEDDNNEIK